MPPLLSSPFDLASAVAKLQGVGLEPLLDTLGIGRKNSESTTPLLPPSQQPEAPGRLLGNPDFAGRDPWHPQYAGLSGQPSGEERLVTLHNGARSPSNEMVQGPDGLYGTNPMTTVLKQRQAAGEEAQRQAQSDETDAMVEEFGKSKARRDAAWDQERAQSSTYDAQRSEAEFQALANQRSRKATSGRGGYLRMGRVGRGPGRG